MNLQRHSVRTSNGLFCLRQVWRQIAKRLLQLLRHLWNGRLGGQFDQNAGSKNQNQPLIFVVTFPFSFLFF